MGSPNAFDGMMHEFCVGLGWCGCVKDGKRLHVTDYIPETGPVSSDEFAGWLVQADGLDRERLDKTDFTRLKSVFEKHMGAATVDARRLRPGGAMEMKRSILTLPLEILGRSSLGGREYAWRIADIPDVIEAARRASLVSIGGQLQTRIPSGGTGELYYVEVRTSVDEALPWQERVARSAEIALRDFQALPKIYDFVAESLLGFGSILNPLIAQGHDPTEFMWFVWYVKSEEEARERERVSGEA